MNYPEDLGIGFDIIMMIAVSIDAIFTMSLLVTILTRPGRLLASHRRIDKPDVFNFLYQELRPIMIYLVLPFRVASDILEIFYDGLSASLATRLVMLVVTIWVLVRYYDNDDRWNKRRKRVLRKIEVRGNRLVVE